MKNIYFLLVAFVVFFWACEGIYDKQADFEGEIVYPAKYDTVIGHIGFERVEIDLLKAGRISSEEINLGKAQKTKIEYDEKVITMDSLVSFVNIEGLTESKLYRFRISTIDRFENESVPQEIALIPFTADNMNDLVVSPPRILASPSAAVVEWPSGISSVLMDYYGLKYEYQDKDGEMKTGAIGPEESRFFIGNVPSGQPVTVHVEYKVIPKVNQEPILDTVYFSDELVINMPTSSSTFQPVEREILAANGVTTFTAEGVSDIEKLTYPVHVNSLQDIFFFPGLKILDLTGGDLFPLTTLEYDRNGVADVVGGGEGAPFIRRAGDLDEGNYQSLKDLLESGILEKVYYRPNTLGLDDLLTPYVEEGIVEWVELPESAMLNNKFQLDGIVQDHNWTMEITYPATDAPQGNNLQDVYKTVCKARSASFVFALPKEYEFNIQEYKYLKMDVFPPEKSTFQGAYTPFQKLWPRFMNSMWSFGGNSTFGQQYWAIDPFEIPDSDLNKWTEITLDLSQALDKHNRVIVLNIGGEPGIDPWAPEKEIAYYFANIRFSKNP